MQKLIIAGLSAVILGLGFAPAQAVDIRFIDRVLIPGAGGGPAPAGESTSPGEPFQPFQPIDTTETSSVNQPGGGEGGPGQMPEPLTASAPAGAGTDNACGGELGQLDRVRASAVRAVGYGDAVDIVPICSGRALAATQNNVGGLRGAIAQNETLTAALRADGYAADHVVGVTVNDSLVVLYVH